jgi:26S proteasome regulatory subunit N5
MLALVKRRAQAKRAITDMINLCMNTFLEKLPSKDEKLSMLASLREASEGKIFLEREYANCTRMQVEMLEAEGKIDEAARVIQEIAIETYGSVESKEKVEFILYQMKLVLARQDYIRTQILSRKITKRALSEAGLEAQRI